MCTSSTKPSSIGRLSPFKRIRFGELDGAHTARCDRLAAALSHAGIEIEHTSLIDPLHQLARTKRFFTTCDKNPLEITLR